MADTKQVSLKDEIEKYTHNLERTMRLQGIEIENLSPTVASPAAHVKALVQAISGSTGIPYRKLLGSERGELASSQDETSWDSVVEQRQNQYAEPMILRPFIDMMINYNVLPEPEEGYKGEIRSEKRF